MPEKANLRAKSDSEATATAMLNILTDADALAERVADKLRGAIVRGELNPGDRIVERKLGQELNVSRTPIREALKLLRADGLVEISKNRGARVAPYTSKDARDLFQVIAALESLAAANFARLMTPGQLEELEGLHATMMAHYHNRDLDPYFAANSAAHDFIVAECGSDVLAESHGRLSLRARRGRYMAIMDARRWKQAVGEHEALMAALRAGDVDKAAKTWEAHLRHTGESVALALDASAQAD